MKTINLTTAQALLKFLSSQYIAIDNVEQPFVHGVFSIFGHGNATGIGEALEYDNYGLKTYRGHNEQGMAHTAISYAKQLNRLGIIACTSSIGPGALNMVTAAGVATSNRIPLLLLPGDIFADRQPDPVLQQIEQAHDYTISANDAFKPVSKYWDRISRPETLMSACINAFRVLTDPAETGAVVLSLPQDVQAESYAYPESFFKKRIWHIDRLTPTERALHAAVELIKKAKNPLIIAGGGIHYSLAAETLQKFASKHKIAVSETQAGKSAMHWQHEFSVGGIGTTGTSSANKLAQKADLILAIASRLQDFTTASKWLYPKAQIVQLNINSLDAVKMDALSIKSDAKLGLDALSKLLGKYQTSITYQTQVAKLKTSWDKEVDKLYASLASKSGKLNQLGVLGALNNFVNKNDTVICAAGSLPGDLHRLWRSVAPKDYHLEYAFSCMGYEVSAGFGVTLAKEYQKINGEAYVVVGDGSFLMLHSEIVSCIQEHKKFTILLLDNHGYQCINNLQLGNGSKGFTTELRYRDKQGNLAGNYVPIDFAKYAEALGVESYTAKSHKELAALLKKTKKSTKPVLIAMVVEPKTMTGGYDSWWRVGVATTSTSKDVVKAGTDSFNETQKSRKY